MSHTRHNLACLKEIGGRLCCSHTGLPAAPAPRRSRSRSDLRPSLTQAEALRRMAAANAPLARQPGGFWTLKEASPSPWTPRPGGLERSWYIDIQTVRAMERKGLVERTNVWPEEWRDERQLTPTGREIGLRP